MDPLHETIPVQEEVEEAEVVQDGGEGEEDGEKQERFDDDFQLFLQRTGPRVVLER